MGFLYSYRLIKKEQKEIELHFWIKSSDVLGWQEKAIPKFNTDFFSTIVLLETFDDWNVFKPFSPSFELSDDRELINSVIKSARVDNVSNFPASKFAAGYFEGWTEEDEKKYDDFWGLTDDPKDWEHLPQFDLIIEVTDPKYISEDLKEDVIMGTTAFDPG